MDATCAMTGSACKERGSAGVGDYYLFRVFTGAELGFATEVRCAMCDVVRGSIVLDWCTSFCASWERPQE